MENIIFGQKHYNREHVRPVAPPPVTPSGAGLWDVLSAP